MSDPIDTSLDNCGCCEPDPQPAPISNRPGLPALSYRVGTHATFLRRMLTQLGRFILEDGGFAGTRPLAPLTTRSLDDPSIALLDASAMVTDVLTFYQERIANEGFLRTATERRSILDLARATGYELSPGVAASVYLAFTVEDAPGAPGRTEIPAGMRVQSVPPQDKLPQTFETSAAITARAEWNALRPRLTYPQIVNPSTRQVYLQGTATNLKVGDHLVIDAGGLQQAFVQSVKVEVQSKLNRTCVDFTVPASIPPYSQPDGLSQGKLNINYTIPFKKNWILLCIYAFQWTDEDLNAFLAFNQWDEEELLAYLSDFRKNYPLSQGAIYALRTALGFFGNSAPLYASLPYKPGTTTTMYPGDTWDNGYQIWYDQQTSQLYSDADADVFLERVATGLIPDPGSYPKSWAVFATPFDQHIYRISSVLEKSLAGFAVSGKVTGLTLKEPNGNPITKPDSYLVRNSVAYVQSEPLTLAELPMGEALDSDATKLELDGLVLGLKAGQAVILTGERADMPGVTASEVLIISGIRHIAGFTELTFETGRKNPYLRSTVALNANVARATHGETVTEILGSGDGAQSNQRFTLKKPPLTFTTAPTPSGSSSTLQLRVNNLLWEEKPSLYGLDRNDPSYIIRLDDDHKATIMFGDGEHGARLPTGVNNVVATYRSGIGLDGEVAADSLTILQSRPLGVRGVTNPLPAGGAGDPEKMDHARVNAPLAVRTLDRIVSRDDYEDFARAFAGIGKAQAVDLWSGEAHLVHLTIAGSDGKPITDADFLGNFLDALDAVRDPTQRVEVGPFDLLLFNLTANIAVDPRYQKDAVFAAVRTALADAFAFDQRIFGQVVTAAEVITAIQKVEGVVFVDLDSLYFATEEEVPNQILMAHTAYAKAVEIEDSSGSAASGEENPIQNAQLLLINPLGVSLREVGV